MDKNMLFQCKSYISACLISIFGCILYANQPVTMPASSQSAAPVAIEPIPESAQIAMDLMVSIEGDIKSRNQDALTKTGNDLEMKLSHEFNYPDANAILRICNAFSTYGFEDKHGRDDWINRDRLRDQFAFTALQSAAKAKIDLPVELEFAFLVHLGFSQHAVSPTSDHLAQRREDEVVLWVHGWRRLQDGINPNFDFDKPIFINMSPRGGYASGISPEAIKEPDIRADYIKRLAENEKNNTDLREQLLLRRIRKTQSMFIISYFSYAYRYPPEDVEQLKKYLAELHDDETAKAILEKWQKTPTQKLPQKSGVTK